MKKIVISSLFILIGVLFLNVKSTNAQVGSMMGNENAITQTQTESDTHTESVETILQNILDKQNVSTVQKLDLSKISDDEWERLGDAVMEVQHPGKAHEVMDQMMGGEGSESLRQMHINMGKAYLGHNSNYGPGMMGNWNNNSSLKGGGFPMMGFGSMMEYGAHSGVYGVLGGLTWIAFIVFLVAGAYFFIKQTGRK